MPRKSFSKTDFVLEIPHLNFEKPVTAVSDMGEVVYLEWFISSSEGLGDWRLGHYHVRSPIFKRKRKFVRKVNTFIANTWYGQRLRVPAVKDGTSSLTLLLVLHKKTMRLTRENMFIPLPIKTRRP